VSSQGDLDSANPVRAAAFDLVHGGTARGGPGSTPDTDPGGQL